MRRGVTKEYFIVNNLLNLCRSPSVSDIGHKDTEEGVTSEKQRIVIDGAGLVTVCGDRQGDDISENISDRDDEDSP